MALRGILFRGQIRRKGEKVNMPSGEPLPSRWCYGGIFAPHMDGKGLAVIYGAEGERDDPITGARLEKCPVYRDTVGQYTGLTDKNGVKIFEDDIACIKHGGKTHIGTIQYDALGVFIFVARGLGWIPLFKLADEDMAQRNGQDLTNIEIIGNVYDNPELLWE